MKAYSKTIAMIGIALMLPAQMAFPQERPEPAPAGARYADSRPAFRQQELDQMLAPIALYPDALLSQILMAATYPLEVVQAARWSKANPGVTGEDAVKALERMNWDPSVKSLVAFPDVLAMMDERLEWTEQLGEAFLAQQRQVMDTIQGLRRRADAAGNLQSDERMAVTRRDEHVVIEPADPQTVYVPYYNPRVVYGPWWWADYPPVYWGPPPGYYYGGPAWWGPGFLWGSGIVIGSGFFFGAFNWPYHHVTVVHSPYYQSYYGRRGIIWTRPGPVAWRHDVFHRRGVPYRSPALQQQSAQRRDQRFEGRRGGAAPSATPSTPRTQPAQGERTRRSGASPERPLDPRASPPTGAARQAAPAGGSSTRGAQNADTGTPGRGADPGRRVDSDRAPVTERFRDSGGRDAAGSSEGTRRTQPGAGPRSGLDRQQTRTQRYAGSGPAPRAERTPRNVTTHERQQFRSQRSDSAGARPPAERSPRSNNRTAGPAVDRSQRPHVTSMNARAY